MKLPPDGLLSSELESWRISARLSAHEYFSLVDEINRSAVAILPRLSIAKWSDREMTAAGMFARALQAFEATILLTERGMLADAGASARNIIECAIFLRGIALIVDFPKRMAASNNAHFFTMAKAIAEHLEGGESGAWMAEASELRDLLAAVESQGHIRRDIKLRSLAKEVGLDTLYEIVYRRLSGDAAHPTLASMERHFGRDNAGQVVRLLFGPQRDGMESILSAAMFAFLAVMSAMNIVFDLPEFHRVIDQYNGRLQALAEE
ncbi:DUF5677 domain-containing protein [Burkholderia gladioli]|uniref:DUF5677 domain-containing protein n=1 Tax=Burkholderia gladioli TaxID=28095 RepID=UPI00163FAFB3|nr:DUF5677 domain-containing protein [Burkholderia gladioli]